MLKSARDEEAQRDAEKGVPGGRSTKAEGRSGSRENPGGGLPPLGPAARGTGNGGGYMMAAWGWGRGRGQGRPGHPLPPALVYDGMVSKSSPPSTCQCDH